MSCKTMSIDLANVPHVPIQIGVAGENSFRTITFDASKWGADYPDATYTVVYRRSDGYLYPVLVNASADAIVWSPTETDTAVSGNGQLEVRLLDGETIGKTIIMQTYVAPSLSGDESEPSTPAPDWVNDVVADADRAEAAVSHYPKIVGGYWYVWSVADGDFVSTGIPAQGENGVSPTVTISAIEGGHRVTITDATGAHTFDVMDGEGGEGGGSSDAVLYTPQSLTPAQQEQARENIHALSADTVIPAAVTEQTVSGWGFTKNAGTYSKPSGGIPASDLAAGVIPDISGKANAADVYTKTEVDQKLVGAMDFKGTKATVAELPTSGSATGDVWHITADGSEWAWNGSAWEELGTAVDLSGYRTASAQDTIDAAQDAAIAAKYTKPSGGIPKADLASDVQASLGKADTALQSHQSLSGYATEQWVESKGYLTQHQSLASYRTASAQDTIDAGKVNTSDLAGVAFSGDYNDLLNRPDDGYIFADEIPTDADHSAKYVLPDGYIYVYGEHTYHRTHNANTGLVNIKPDTNANYQSLSAQSGVLTSDLIPFSTDWVPTTADRANSTIKVSGLEKLVPAYYNSSIIVYLYYADGSWMGAARTSQIASLGPPAPALGSEITLPVEWFLKDSAGAGVVGGWANVGYVRVLIGVSTAGNISADDVAGVVISVPYYDEDVTATEWYNTGERYVADPQVQQNTEDIAALKTRMSNAEDDVSAVSDSLENGSFSNVSTGQVLYAVGDSITYGYGVGGNSGSWVRHVIDRNGYDTTNSRNLGESGLGFCTASTSNHTVQDIVGGTDFSGADIVTVALGINDWKNYNALLTDVWSGMEYCFRKIRTDNPYCKIYFVVPFNVSIGTSAYSTFYGLGYAGDNNPLRPYAHTLLEFIGMLKARFAMSPLNAYNVQIIDLTEGVAINRQNINTALMDHLHPTASTHAVLGKVIAPILRLNNGLSQTAAQVQTTVDAALAAIPSAESEVF